MVCQSGSTRGQLGGQQVSGWGRAARHVGEVQEEDAEMGRPSFGTMILI